MIRLVLFGSVKPGEQIVFELVLVNVAQHNGYSLKMKETSANIERVVRRFLQNRCILGILGHFYE